MADLLAFGVCSSHRWFQRQLNTRLSRRGDTSDLRLRHSNRCISPLRVCECVCRCTSPGFNERHFFFQIFTIFSSLHLSKSADFKWNAREASVYLWDRNFSLGKISFYFYDPFNFFLPLSLFTVFAFLPRFMMSNIIKIIMSLKLTELKYN